MRTGQMDSICRQKQRSRGKEGKDGGALKPDCGLRKNRLRMHKQKGDKPSWERI